MDAGPLKETLLGEIYDQLAVNGPMAAKTLAKTLNMETAELLRIADLSDWFIVDLDKNVIQIALKP